MTDLVERLRARAFRLATRDMNGDGATLAKEAADELEKAWAERDAARAIADKLAGALLNAEEIIAGFIGMYGDSGAGLVLKQVRAALAEYDAAKR